MRQRKTHKTRRGFAALLLSLCAIVATFAVALPARAAADDDVYVPELPKGVEGRQADTLQDAAKMLSGRQGTIYLTGTTTVSTAIFGDSTDVTIRSYGEGAKLTVTKSGESANMLTLSNGAKVTLENVVFDASKNTEGRTVSVKGGSTLTLGNGSVLENNTAYGAVYLDGSTINVAGGAIRNNAANGQVGEKTYPASGSWKISTKYVFDPSLADKQGLGGAVLMVNGSHLNMTGDESEISGNTATAGGAVYAFIRSDITLGGGELSRNKAETKGSYTATGGALCVDGDGPHNVTVGGAAFIGNSAMGGGAMYFGVDAKTVNLTVTKGTFSQNSAVGDGSVFFSEAADVVMDICGEETIFTENTAGGLGGICMGMYPDNPKSERAQIYVHNGVTFTKNVATKGSCLYASRDVGIKKMMLDGVKFSENETADNAGVIQYNVPDSVFMIQNCEFTGNKSQSGAGGCIYTAQDAKGTHFTVDTTTFEGNSANGQGGVWRGFPPDAEILFKNCVFKNNTSQSNSGGCFHFPRDGINSTITVDGCSFTGNSAGTSGGVLQANLNGERGSLTLKNNVRFENNTSAQYGGAVCVPAFSEGTTVTVDACTFTGNRSEDAAQGGGALYLSMPKGTITLNDSTFTNNTAQSNGGALYLAMPDGMVTLNDSTFTNNTAQSNGGALYLAMPDGTVTLNGSTFTNNTAQYSGGAVFAPDANRGAEISVEACSFTGNKAEGTPWKGGGALYVSVPSARISLKGSEFESNYAKCNGAAVYVSDQTKGTGVEIDSCTFTKNTSDRVGGGLFVNLNEASTLTVSGTTSFTENSAASNGGALAIYGDESNSATVQLKQCDIIGNECRGDVTPIESDYQEATFHYNTGGIYIGEYVTCYMNDALVTGNYVETGYTDNLVGSGIGLCPNAEVALYPRHGTKVYGNGDGDGMDILAVPYDPSVKYANLPRLYISDTTPDGKDYNWTDLNGGTARTGEYNWDNVLNVNGVMTMSADDGYHGEKTTDPVGFKAHVADAGIMTTAVSDENEYRVRIIGNHSDNAMYAAGGMMVNGTVISGGFGVSIMKETKGLSEPEKETKTFQFEFDITPYDNSGDIEVPFTKTKKDIPVGDGGTITFKYETDIGSDSKKEGMQAIIDLKSDEKITLILNAEENPKFTFEADTDYEFYLTEIDDGGAAEKKIEFKALDEDGNEITGDLSTAGGPSKKVQTIQFTATNIFTELDLTKVVEGGGDEEKLWIFNLTLQEMEGGTPLSGTYPVELWDSEGKIDYTGDEHGMHLTNGDGEITLDDKGETTVYLKHGQTLKIKGLPLGSYYSVTEASLEGYTTTSKGASGTIPVEGGTVVAQFTNTYTLGGLTVRKTVDGDGGNPQDAFNFRVELSDKTVTGAYGQMTFKNGVAEFTLRHGESKTASGLPKDITYTVTEKEAEGYTSAATGATGTIQSGATALASFVNRRVMPDIPQTGDEGRPLLWAALACAGALGALLLVRRLRREP